jgi:hypothetical protein
MACSSFEDPMIHFHCVFLKLLNGFVERESEVILSSKKNFEPASSQVAVSKPLEFLQLKFVTIKKGKGM